VIAHEVHSAAWYWLEKLTVNDSTKYLADYCRLFNMKWHKKQGYTTEELGYQFPTSR